MALGVRRAWIVAAIVSALLLAVSHGAWAQPIATNDAPPKTCAPGADHPCACGDGNEGAQRCADDGQRFGACVCAPPAPALPPPRPRLVPVGFRAYSADHAYTVQVLSQSCGTPCTLLLPEGPTRLSATGSGAFDVQFVVPHYAAHLRLAHDDSDAYIRAGAILLPTGLVVASSMWSLAFACNGMNGCWVANVIIWPIAGASITTAGIVLLAVAGGQRPEGDANRPEIIGRGAVPTLRLTGFGLAPIRSGAVGGVAFQF